MAIEDEKDNLRDYVQAALEDLYDPVALRRNPLIDILKIEDVDRPAETLRQILTEAIESRKPHNDIPSHTNAWRFYYLLRQTHLEQFSQRDIANNLAISPRQLRRIKPLALQDLTDYLISHYRHLHLPSLDRAPEGEGEDEKQTLSRETELERVSHAYPSRAIPIRALFEDVVQIVHPLMQEKAVQIECELQENLPPLAVQAESIRHALINIFSALLHNMERGVLQISVTLQDLHVIIELCPAFATDEHCPPELLVSENIQIARELLSISRASIDIQSSCRIVLRLPTAEQATVLVADDNEDALQLFERYLSGTRYRFVGIQDPKKVLKTAQDIQPDLVVLDLMLPDTDGWRLLAELRQQSQTRRIPIIVCTILPQKDLALALGAADLIQKPVSRQDFIAALDQQMEAIPQS